MEVENNVQKAQEIHTEAFKIMDDAGMTFNQKVKVRNI